MEAEKATKSRPWVLIVLIFVAVAAIAIDQITKFLVVQNLTLGEAVPILGGLIHFNFVKNSGAAFSIGVAYTWIFSILAAAVTVFIIWFARRIRSFAWAVVFGLLLGGTLGNLSDRLFREPGFGVGHVVDFITIPLLPAIFNMADVAITSAMVLFLILVLRGVGLDGKRSGADLPDSSGSSGDSSGDSSGAAAGGSSQKEPADAAADEQV